MKKLILIFGAFSIICVIVSSVADMKIQSINEPTEATVAASEAADNIYTVKSENGKIVVYKGDTLYLRTDTAVSTLPKPDQTQLLYGISVSSKEQMQDILNDYCS